MVVPRSWFNIVLTLFQVEPLEALKVELSQIVIEIIWKSTEYVQILTK